MDEAANDFIFFLFFKLMMIIGGFGIDFIFLRIKIEVSNMRGQKG